MNIWDILILCAVGGLIAFAVRMLRKSKKGCGCGCAGCTAGACPQKKEKNT